MVGPNHNKHKAIGHKNVSSPQRKSLSLVVKLPIRAKLWLKAPPEEIIRGDTPKKDYGESGKSSGKPSGLLLCKAIAVLDSFCYKSRGFYALIIILHLVHTLLIFRFAGLCSLRWYLSLYTSIDNRLNLLCIYITFICTTALPIDL